ncbi:N-acetylneuraminate synthase family protein [Prosthecochloris sp. N3]|uniref:N-acetylneuraminate synthase family protein n=1 Tax=Prosthecochloris ethylica TaxID=2743976 RepID=A0ABR9XPD8_9CHLB|nr:N-acetylneuraminate synthase family protein [Prosthecochloris ethylica]MBF0586127.1 N-acetylneuraminate synthase family protein [Prosthecochloris ethylica]MBF0635833.1 N-acetylneuraminate synthase family protein [Prosthecochloris ethylica]NUK47491.1 N-acetylneuraminate synthase family protein [Prosthecochloris ethylica]
MPVVRIGDRQVGTGCPVFVIAEIGINHNGSLETARKLIDGAVEAGCDAVKFQKRTPEVCVPREQWEIERDTPWGRMTYIDYRYRVEFDAEQYREIDAYCRERGIQWFASCWDEPSVEFMEQFDPPCYKVSSASLTDLPLLEVTRRTGRPVILSTGMSTLEEVQNSVKLLGTDNLVLAHTNSSYPCPVEELNLRMIATLKEMYPEVPVGYSGHEVGLATTWAAVALGAVLIERHVTLDRAMWGSDQAASVEMPGLKRLVSNIRDIEQAMGDGIKRVYEGEQAARKKLRRV